MEQDILKMGCSDSLYKGLERKYNMKRRNLRFFHEHEFCRLRASRRPKLSRIFLSQGATYNTQRQGLGPHSVEAYSVS